jgi:hypothetical protein
MEDQKKIDGVRWRMNNQGVTEEETRDRAKWSKVWVLENRSGEVSAE